MSDPTIKRKRIKQFILTFTPFFVLTLLFIGFNFWPGWINQFNQPTLTEVNSVEVVKEIRESNLVETKPVEIETAVMPTPTIIPQSTSSPQSTIPPEAKIVLIGPPEESIFPSTNNITFYWNWPLTITENQQFALTIINANQEHQIATIDEQNLGQQYALTIKSGAIKPTESEAPLFWQIQLINNESGTILAQSEQRAIALVSQTAQP